MEKSFKEFIYFHKNKIIGFFLTVMVIGGGFLTYYIYDNKDNKIDTKEVKNNNILVKDNSDKNEKKDETNYCYFDIKGSVYKPGVYKIDCNKRIIDQTCPIMIQELKRLFVRKPLISIEI